MKQKGRSNYIFQLSYLVRTLTYARVLFFFFLQYIFENENPLTRESETL